MGGQSFSLKMLWDGSPAGMTFTSFPPPPESSELLAEVAVTRASAMGYAAGRPASSALSVALCDPQ